MLGGSLAETWENAWEQVDANTGAGAVVRAYGGAGAVVDGVRARKAGATAVEIAEIGILIDTAMINFNEQWDDQ